MAALTDIIGGTLVAAGAFFYVVGAIGIYRMPDVFTRMHAASVSETLGVGLLVAGMMAFAGLSLVTVKLAIILGIIFFTSPMATHALAQAVLHEGIAPAGVGNEILIGPGAHPGPEKIGRPKAKPKRTRSRRAARKPEKSASARRRTGKQGGRAGTGAARRRVRT